MIDELKYQIPLGILGDLAHSIFVKKKVAEIFKFRERALEKIFGSV
jgi:ligand-binding SRPBCC domain-containing protein